MNAGVLRLIIVSRCRYKCIPMREWNEDNFNANKYYLSNMKQIVFAFNQFFPLHCQRSIHALFSCSYRNDNSIRFDSLLKRIKKKAIIFVERKLVWLFIAFVVDSFLLHFKLLARLKWYLMTKQWWAKQYNRVKLISERNVTQFITVIS